MAQNNKVWIIKGQNEALTDVELRRMISEGKVNLKTEVYTQDMDKPIAIEDSIYLMLFKENKND